MAIILFFYLELLLYSITFLIQDTYYNLIEFLFLYDCYNDYKAIGLLAILIY